MKTINIFKIALMSWMFIAVLSSNASVKSSVS